MIRSFKMAVKSISANKGRSFLTMLGIIIGVAAVIALVSLVQGQQNAILAEFEKMGTNQVQASYYIWNGSDKDYTDTLYAYCKSLGDDVVQGMSPQMYSGGGEVRYKAKKAEYPNVYLASDQYTICASFTINRGRDLCYMDIQRMNKVCILGSKVVDDLFNYENPVGKKITIGGESYTVIGTYASKDVSQEYGGSYNDNIIVVPYTLKSRINKSPAGFGGSDHQYIFKAASKEATTELVKKLEDFFRLRVSDESGHAYVYTNNEYMNYQTEGLAEQSVFLGIIASIALLVGGIGIMNIMLVTVTERTKEIGIRKAIGAPRRAIITQFLIESSLLSSMGGILGIILGYCITPVLGKILPAYAKLGIVIMPAPFIVVIAFFVSVAFGVGFGVYPAVRASNLQPVDALRSE